MARPIQDTILLLGDSLTSRQDVPNSLQARFCEAYRRTMDVANRGLGGYNTRFYVPLLDEMLLRQGEPGSRIRLVTIWFGANDAVLRTSPTQQHVPIPEYTSNLTAIFRALTSPKSSYSVAHQDVPLNIILITPPPLYPEMMTDEAFKSQRKVNVTEEYREAVLHVGQEWKAKAVASQKNCRIETVDLWDKILEEAGGQGEGLRDYLTDGLHLTTKGYDVLWKDIHRILKTDFAGRGIDPDDMEFSIADWSRVDYSDPTSAQKSLRPPYRR
ncbi:SGNH hydrolase-type esterase domain-containing protein [Naematelia encephala]|uniref:SGNH hydrolase-type esterase domain-containing protein n=1 Tax=Naematelia encephala TaxID=71784 RepID=A0A1Y2BLX1_9TREE|nr:SGNH hydrolase-type esterase domain-containing protein [Naematelia encephala]